MCQCPGFRRQAADDLGPDEALEIAGAAFREHLAAACHEFRIAAAGQIMEREALQIDIEGRIEGCFRHPHGFLAGDPGGEHSPYAGGRGTGILRAPGLLSRPGVEKLKGSVG